jgi:hypothetical protein
MVVYQFDSNKLLRCFAGANGGSLSTYQPSSRTACQLDTKCVNTRPDPIGFSQSARDSLLKAGANILGVVINDRPHHIPEWLYKRL